MVITANPPKFDKRQPSKGGYDAIVYIDGSEVVAEDSNGRKIASGVAGTDDAVVINSGADAIRSTGGTLQIGSGTYNIGGNVLNFSGITHSTFRLCMQVGTKIISSAIGLPIMDFTGTYGAVVENGFLVGSLSNPPSCGILFCRDPSGNTAGQHLVQGTRIEGNFTSACLYNCGSEEDTYIGLLLSNAEKDAFAAKFVYNNVDSITSPHSTPTGGFSMTGVWIYGSRFVHTGSYTGGTKNGGAIYVGAGYTGHIHIDGAYLNSNGYAKIHFLHPGYSLTGPFSFRNIHCEGASVRSIYGNCKSVTNLLIDGYDDKVCTANAFVFEGGCSLTDCFFRNISLNPSCSLLGANTITGCSIDGIYRFDVDANLICNMIRTPYSPSLGIVVDGSNVSNIILGTRNTALTLNRGSSTGTGSEQTIAHGLVAAPSKVVIVPTETGATVSATWADATNIYATVTTGKAFNWSAEV